MSIIKEGFSLRLRKLLCDEQSITKINSLGLGFGLITFL